MTIGKEELISGLKKAGVHEGINLIVHSSLSSFGDLEGGAETVIDALQETVGKGGTIVMPSFNHGRAYKNGELFDIRKTKTINGAIPDSFWRRSDVIRSVNPTHSFAAWGKNSEKYLENHRNVDTMGIGSPLYMLMEDGGYCLMIGTDYRSNTFHHLVETLTGAPCLSPRGERYPMVLADGTIEMVYTWSWRDGVCPINDGGEYAFAMKGIEQHGRAGNAELIMYPLREGFEIISRCLRSGAADNPGCAQCGIRPRVCEYTV